jgi:hypothetical protein
MKPYNYIHQNSRLIFLELIDRNTPELKLKKKIARYQCTCGVKKIIAISEVKNGKTLSCGCFRKEQRDKSVTTHGLTKHPLFSVWSGIINRCYNKNVHNYNDYGGRGVKMCDEWRNDFKVFFDWCINNGWEKGLQIDKDIKSNNLGIHPIYSPETCTVLSGKVNMSRTRNSVFLTFNGETKNITEWAELLGLKRQMLYDRVALGWPDEKILFHPKRQYPI